MFNDLLEAGEYAPCRSGLFRPLRSPVYEGTLVCSGVSFKTKDQEEKYLVGVPLVMEIWK